ncbi:unnamed protein product [Ilex paraguariensis]|uniref:Uncharacterized protein n=1 Tax=Ilex paraguariensis TaxID=185542 RepID=A0ABC8TCB8_9AQUA
MSDCRKVKDPTTTDKPKEGVSNSVNDLKGREKIGNPVEVHKGFPSKIVANQNAGESYKCHEVYGSQMSAQLESDTRNKYLFSQTDQGTTPFVSEKSHRRDPMPIDGNSRDALDEVVSIVSSSPVRVYEQEGAVLPEVINCGLKTQMEDVPPNIVFETHDKLKEVGVHSKDDIDMLKHLDPLGRGFYSDGERMNFC